MTFCVNTDKNKILKDTASFAKGATERADFVLEQFTDKKVRQ